MSTVSPSLAAQLEVCPLAAIFARDPEFRRLANRGTHFGALGEICHLLWEREGRGDFDNLEDDALGGALNAAWDEAEGSVVRELRTSLDGVQPPPPRKWPDYLAKRLGVLGLIKRSVLRRRGHRAKLPARHRPLVEDPIEIPGLRLRGRPDRVIWNEGVPHIIDLKTCAPGEQMSSEHRRQLLAYAYLVHAEHGIWPATATIQYVGGEKRTFDLDPLEAEAVAAEMIRALERVNAFAGEPEALARPSPTACRWCTFKAACAPFFTAVDEAWDLYDRHVLGTAEAVDIAGPRPSLTVRVARGNLGEEWITAVASDPVMLDGVSVGDTVAIAGAMATRSPTTVRCDWNTVVCVWDDQQALEPTAMDAAGRVTPAGLAPPSSAQRDLDS
jgi:hypothetical protein